MTTTEATSTDAPARRDWVEIVATVLLAFAAVATAWSSYQANRWNGETTKASSRVNALRIEAARAPRVEERHQVVDLRLRDRAAERAARQTRGNAPGARALLRLGLRPADEDLAAARRVRHTRRVERAVHLHAAY